MEKKYHTLQKGIPHAPRIGLVPLLVLLQGTQQSSPLFRDKSWYHLHLLVIRLMITKLIFSRLMTPYNLQNSLPYLFPRTQSSSDRITAWSLWKRHDSPRAGPWRSPGSFPSCDTPSLLSSCDTHSKRIAYVISSPLCLFSIMLVIVWQTVG